MAYIKNKMYVRIYMYVCVFVSVYFPRVKKMSLVSLLLVVVVTADFLFYRMCECANTCVWFYNKIQAICINTVNVLFE